MTQYVLDKFLSDSRTHLGQEQPMAANFVPPPVQDGPPGRPPFPLHEQEPSAPISRLRFDGTSRPNNCALSKSGSAAF